ncbi:MAG: AGE family epimerase/isomerase [Candidatus Hydrogenedentes bacterium]|nr:AGE family epimerase/isomerase [Candidatus Hydrogenedentota bacterium]
MSTPHIGLIRDRYRTALLDDVLPFWMRHIRDDEMGGYLHHIDADGSVVSTDKCFWMIGRAVWMYSKAYNDIERRPEWLDFARLGYEFILKHGFDTDGRMFYTVTRDGRPLRKRRYLFTETFGVIALSEYGKATGDAAAIDRARTLYRKVIALNDTPDASMPPKFYPTRPMKSHAMPMIIIAMTQVLRRNGDDPFYEATIDRCIDEVLNHFLHHEKRALFETVEPNGELLLDIPEGRCINPGHALETAWFLLEEARHRKDDALIAKALPIIDYSMDLGWDDEYGGILYFVDIDGRPPEPYEHDMKLWWVHCEALYANLLAYRLTGEQRYWDNFEKIDQYAFAHFPDPKQGEWFGYLHRDGTLANTVKGSKWKAPFHLPRMLLNVWYVLDEMLEG